MGWHETQIYLATDFSVFFLCLFHSSNTLCCPPRSYFESSISDIKKSSALGTVVAFVILQSHRHQIHYLKLLQFLFLLGGTTARWMVSLSGPCIWFEINS